MTTNKAPPGKVEGFPETSMARCYELFVDRMRRYAKLNAHVSQPNLNSFENQPFPSESGQQCL
jgi:hypothetical protein